MKFLVAVAFMAVLAVVYANGWNDRGSDRGYGNDDGKRGSRLVLVSRSDDKGWGRSSGSYGRSYGNDDNNKGWGRTISWSSRSDNNDNKGWGRSSDSYGRSDNNNHGWGGDNGWNRDSGRNNGYGKRW